MDLVALLNGFLLRLFNTHFTCNIVNVSFNKMLAKINENLILSKHGVGFSF